MKFSNKCSALTMWLCACVGPGSSPVASESATLPAVEQSAEANDSPLASAAPKLERPWRETYPTLENAGATACRILPPVELGPRHDGDTIVGFGPRGGVATFKRGPTTLAVQPIGFDAAITGEATTVSVTEGAEPTHVFWVDRGFVILLRLWDWQSGHASWTGLFVEQGGGAHGPVDIGLDGMDVRVAQVLEGPRVGLIVDAAAIANDKKKPGRWQTLTLQADGRLTSSPFAVAVDDLVTTTNDAWEPAELAARRGWIVLREGKARREGVFDGVREAAGGATPLRPSTSISATVHNGAVVPPGGPGGTIREAMGLPILLRTRAGEAIGERLFVEWQGDRVGVSGMYIESLLFWSGSHFVYPFRSDQGASLLPIDCRATNTRSRRSRLLAGPSR